MPDTTPAADRELIVHALAAELMPRYGGPQHRNPGALPLTATAEEAALHRAQPLADAVMAVLPALMARLALGTTDRAAVLREAADEAASHADFHGGKTNTAGRSLLHLRDVFRRLADEAQQPEAAGCKRCGCSPRCCACDFSIPDQPEAAACPHAWVTALDGNDRPALDETGSPWTHCGVCGARRDLPATSTTKTTQEN